jgi:hypothetical protein
VVEGTLHILGAVDFPVNITSLYDDSLADTALTTATLARDLRPTTSPWAGITVANGGTLTASHTNIAYGGWAVSGPNTAQFPRATIRNLGATTFTNVTINNSHSTALTHEGGSLTTTNLTLNTAPQGIAISAPTYDITNTTIRNMTSGSLGVISLASLLGKVTGTVGEGNIYNGITFAHQNISAGQTAHFYPNAISYYSDTNHTIAGTLYLHPGTFVQHADTTYTIAPTGKILIGDGTGDAPILTSLWDNAQQGETRGTVFPNTNRAPKSGDWRGVAVEEGGEVDTALVKKYNGF